VRVWRRDGTGGEQWAARLEHLQGHTNWRCNDVATLLGCLHGLIAPHDGSAENEALTSVANEAIAIEWGAVQPDHGDPPLPR